MDGDTGEISIEGGKAEQKTQHQQNIEKVQRTYRSTLQDRISVCYTSNKTQTKIILDC